MTLTIAQAKTEIEPELALAISMRSKPGVYALLLGSGISRSAEIPTGWEIVVDLLRQVSQHSAKTKDEIEALVNWYKEKFNAEPTYSRLLEEIARSDADRTNLLNSYFEVPSNEEFPLRGKPTKAHRKIAELVSKGYIQVIVTTNFDRLMEDALKSEGVESVVVAHASEISRIQPIQHNRCTLIKVHGDYKSTILKNTPKELGEYEPEWIPYLQRIFTEYGIVICGWSGVCDDALRGLLDHVSPLYKNRLYSTYWCSCGELRKEGSMVVEARRAVRVNITDADTFFEKLADSITALEDLTSNSKSITSQIASQRVKNYLFDSSAGAKLHDFVLAEARKAKESIDQLGELKNNNDQQRIEVDQIMEVLKQIVATASYWHTAGKLSMSDYGNVWQKISKIFYPVNSRADTACVYPLTSLLYCAGIGSVAAKNYEVLAQMIRVTGFEIDVIQQCFVWLQNGNAGTSNFLSKKMLALEPLFNEMVPDHGDFKMHFDTFEYLLGIAFCTAYKTVPDRLQKKDVFRGNAVYFGESDRIAKNVNDDFSIQGGNFPPLAFIGSWDDFVSAKGLFEDRIKK